MDDSLRYRILKELQQDPNISQRDLASKLGISLGKVNYCLQGLIHKGWVKANNFKNSKNKLAYAYYLTPSGFDEKAQLTINYLKRRISEYEALEIEIEELRKEVNTLSKDNP